MRQVSVSRFTVAVYALAQIAVAWSLIALRGLFFHDGRGQIVKNILQMAGN